MDSTMYFLSDDDRCSNLMPVESVMSTSCGSIAAGSRLGAIWPRRLIESTSKTKNAAGTPRKTTQENGRIGGVGARVTMEDTAVRSGRALIRAAQDLDSLSLSTYGTAPFRVEHGRAGSTAHRGVP